MSEENMSTPVENTESVENTQVQQEQLTEAQQEQIRKYKVKINNEELEVDEEELLRGYQTRKAADEKFREAAMARKQAEEVIALLKNEDSVFDVLAKLGYDPRDLSEKYLVKQLEEESLSPEEKKLREYERKLAEFENEKKQKEKQMEEEQRLQLINKYTADYSNQVVEALETSGLPKTPHTVKRMAYYLHQGLQRGYDLTAKDVVKLVKEDYIEEQKSLLGGLDPDAITQLLGKETVAKLRKQELSKLKKPSNSKPVVGKSNKKAKPQKTFADFRKELESKYRK